MDNINVGKNNKYYARTIKAKLKYPAGKNTSPYGLLLLDDLKSNTEKIIDLCALRPNVTDFIKSDTPVEVVVLYERVKYTDIDSIFPRYILYGDTLFTNVRNIQK